MLPKQLTTKCKINCIITELQFRIRLGVFYKIETLFAI